MRRAARALLPLGLLVLGAWANWPEALLPPDATADRVLVEKRAHHPTLLRNRQVLKTYHIALGRRADGPKRQEGDHRTPEGMYVIDRRNPQSTFHLALHLSYPNTMDAEQARARGVSPGGDIMIHGLRNGLGWIGKLHRVLDWTNGCVAVTDAEMNEIRRAVPDGTQVEIVP